MSKEEMLERRVWLDPDKIKFKTNIPYGYFEKPKGIDVYIDSGVHLKGFSELTEEAKELAKKKFIDEIKDDTVVLTWDIKEEIHG